MTKKNERKRVRESMERVDEKVKFRGEREKKGERE